MPTQLTQPNDTNKQHEAPATVSHACNPPSGKLDGGFCISSSELDGSLYSFTSVTVPIALAEVLGVSASDESSEKSCKATSSKCTWSKCSFRSRTKLVEEFILEGWGPKRNEEKSTMDTATTEILMMWQVRARKWFDEKRKRPMHLFCIGIRAGLGFCMGAGTKLIFNARAPLTSAMHCMSTWRPVSGSDHRIRHYGPKNGKINRKRQVFTIIIAPARSPSLKSYSQYIAFLSSSVTSL